MLSLKTSLPHHFASLIIQALTELNVAEILLGTQDTKMATSFFLQLRTWQAAREDRCAGEEL